MKDREIQRPDHRERKDKDKKTEQPLHFSCFGKYPADMVFPGVKKPASPMLMVKTLPFGKVDSSWPPEKSGFVRGPLIHQNISETPEICHSGLKSFNLPEHLGRGANYFRTSPHIILFHSG